MYNHYPLYYKQSEMVHVEDKVPQVINIQRIQTGLYTVVSTVQCLVRGNF